MKGTRPRIAKQQGFKSVQIFGAVCPAKDKAFALVFEATDKDIMEAFLQKLSEEVKDGKHIVLIMDGAGYHKNLKCPKNISIVTLPPYSPELNPIEQVWQFIKDKWLSNRYFADIASVHKAVDEAWNNFLKLPGKIVELCFRRWATL
jgi:transposase